MREDLNEPVDVLVSFVTTPQRTVRISPHLMSWRGKRYKVTTMGLYHPQRQGTKRIHIFEFAAEEVKFRLELDPDSLEWTLKEVFYG